MCLLNHPAKGQELSRYRWKNRILLVVTSDTLAPDYLKQMDSIRSDPDGLDERKLIVYGVTPSGYREDITHGKWIQSPELYRKFHQKGNTLEVVLIGLDGQVKHRSGSLIPLSQVFSWIDAMPMRMEELRKKQAPGI